MNEFDFFTGTWDVANRRLKDYLDGESGWEEFPGVSHASSHFRGGANFDEIDFPTLGVTGLTLRLFDREEETWSLNWSSSRTGRLDPPVVGRFGADGRGEFYGDDVYDGKDIKVRFIWSNISATTARWEQAFSVDGGETWLVNWTMDFTRRP